MYLEEIMEDIQLESDKFENKAILNRGDVVGWLKSIVGFANALGGDRKKRYVHWALSMRLDSY